MMMIDDDSFNALGPLFLLLFMKTEKVENLYDAISKSFKNARYRGLPS